MHIEIDSGWLVATLLASLRLGALFLMSPLLAGLGSMTMVRVLLCFSLAAMMGGVVPHAPGLSELTLGQLVFAAAAELVIGAALAFAVFSAFAAFSIAGKVLDVQAGFGIGSVYDPVTRAGAPLFASLLNIVGVAVFFGLDGHHALLRGFVYSLERAPIGAGFAALSPEVFVQQFGLMFTLAVSLVIPVIVCMLLVETGLAVFSRVLPQMNVFVVAAPAKIVAGIAILALASSTFGPSMSRIFASIFQCWERLFG
jgi:flagellar biosynthesis protein FliR